MLSSIPTVENSPGFSGNLRTRLRERTLLFRFLAEINLIFGIWYLQWRIGHSINFNALWLSIPLLLAEIYSYLGGVMFTLGLWRPVIRQIKPLEQMTPKFPASDWPTVDVFITCYNEPPEMVEETAQAALNIDYPVEKLRVYILDDGNSPEMRSVAAQLNLQDLQSPLLRQEAERLETQRSQWVERLQQLQNLALDTQAAEAFLQNSPAPDHPPASFLQTWQKFVLLISPNAETVSDRLHHEIQATEAAIHQKELELSQLGRCRYIARSKPAGKAHHAKAGNINHAIFSGETNGEFILTLDADHVPKPQFLKNVLPYFYTYHLWNARYESNRIALVQTPQDFYNLPNGDPFGHSASLFYGPIQQGKDGWNSAFYTGTNAVLRREALIQVGLSHFSQEFAANADRLDEFDLVGGMSSNSITEDMNTAMRLHASGWKSVYHSELLAEGLAPDDLSSTLKQRLRWAQGTIQVLVRENPLTKPGLSFWQRLQYFQTMYSYFSGFATLIFVICPIIYFFTGIIPISSYGPVFALHFFPAFILNRVTFLAAAWGIPARQLWRSEQYAVALFPLFIQAVWSVFTNKPIKFQVTPKQRQAGIYYRLVWPQVAIFALTLASLLFGLGRLILAELQNPNWDQPLAYGLNALWAIYNMTLLWAVIRAARWQPPQSTDA